MKSQLDFIKGFAIRAVFYGADYSKKILFNGFPELASWL